MSTGTPHDPEPVAEDDDWSRPIATTRHVVPTWRWTEWESVATAVDRRATWVSRVVGVLVGAALVVPGVLLLPREWWVAVGAYGLLGTWGAGRLAAAGLRRRGTRQVVEQMRDDLRPAEISRYESSLLVSLLLHDGASSGDRARLLQVERGPAQTVVVEHEYAMDKVPPVDYPSSDSGVGG